MSNIITAAMLGAFTLAFTVAPAAFDPSSATLSVSKAFAKHGADDANDNTSGEGETRDRGGKRNDDVILSKNGADDAADTHEDGRRGRGRGSDDAANHG